MDDAEQRKYIKMTTEPVEKLIRELAVPTMIAMLVTSLYNIVDTFFVGRIGTEATAGVGLILPIMAIIQAFGFFFGQGSGNYISRALGARDTEKAEKMAATGAISSIIFGTLILILGTSFDGALLSFLGAKPGLVSDKTVAFAGDYMRIILCGAPFMCLSCVLNNQLRFQGNALFSMIGLVSGAVLNCILDPIFIFVLKLEVRGAAYATIISQFIGTSLLYAGTLKSDNLKIHLRNFRPTPFYFKNICVGGLPSLFRQALSSLATLSLNTAAGSAVPPSQADASIAAFSIVGKVMLFAFSALLGFGQGFQPVCGFNYGAGKYSRVRKGYIFCIKVAFAVLLCLAALGFIFAGNLIALFRDDPDVISYGATAMRCQCCTIVLASVIVMTNMTYQNIGRVVGAVTLAIARQGLFFIPLVLILPKLFPNPIWGVYLAQPCADICTFVVALILGIRIYRELKEKEEL